MSIWFIRSSYLHAQNGGRDPLLEAEVLLDAASPLHTTGHETTVRIFDGVGTPVARLGSGPSVLEIGEALRAASMRPHGGRSRPRFLRPAAAPKAVKS